VQKTVRRAWARQKKSNTAPLTGGHRRAQSRAENGKQRSNQQLVCQGRLRSVSFYFFIGNISLLAIFSTNDQKAVALVIHRKAHQKHAVLSRLCTYK
jgi:hypothetical protein